jgi:hypothetical protein
VKRSGNKVAQVTPPWYDNHNFKPMSPCIMLGRKPLAKHYKKSFKQTTAVAVFYLFEACLHSFDDPGFLKDAFNTIIERATYFLPSRDHGMTPEFVMGMDKCIRYTLDIVAKD